MAIEHTLTVTERAGLAHDFAQGHLEHAFNTARPIMEANGYEYDGDRFDDDGKFVKDGDGFARDLQQAVQMITQDYRTDRSDELGR